MTDYKDIPQMPDLTAQAIKQREKKERAFPVAEIFGPTIQGEGVDQGRPCHFVRFGGCDYRCDWCDTPHAVLPDAVRRLPRMTAQEIVAEVRELTQGPSWVVLSGGNPALHDLQEVVDLLRTSGYRTSVETQGTRFKPWLREVNRLCISPKPPSSTMTFNPDVFFSFLQKVLEGREYDEVWTGNVFIKVVVFDHADYVWAKDLMLRIYDESGGVGLPFFLSAGNDAGMTVGNPGRVDTRDTAQVRADLISKYVWLVNRVMVDPVMQDVIVQHQDHVIAWGNERGR